jgi:hypothetical protein
MSIAVQPDKLFNFERYGEWLLACPECGCAYTHIQNVWSLEGACPFEGAAEHGELFNAPVGGTTENRRGALVISVWSECGHSFEIEFSNARGETFVRPRMIAEVL